MAARRVVFVATGSDGDVNPFIAVAAQMRARGWSVRVLAAPEHEAKVVAAGLDFGTMSPGWADVPALAGLSPERFVRGMARDDVFMFRKLLIPAAPAACEQARPHLEGADLVVVHHLALGAQIAATAAGAPMAVLALEPIILLSAEDPPALASGPWLPRLKQLAGVGATRAALAAGLALSRRHGRSLEALRTRVGLPPAQGHWLHAGVRGALATVCLWSPLLGGVRADHPRGTTLAGSVFYDQSERGADAALEAFLAAGPPPLVLTLGSVAALDPSRFFVEGVAAGRRLGLRCVIAAGTGDQAVRHLEAPDVFVTGYAPYRRLFSSAAIVAHHGGIGSCLEALRAGAPQLLAPLLSDQHDNARRVAGLGAAGVVPLRRWTADRAFAAAEPLMAEAVKRRAAALASKVRAERGVERAADALEAAALVASRGPPRQDFDPKPKAGNFSGP